MNSRQLLASFVAIVISGILPAANALADDVSNNLDVTVDSNLEAMALSTGGSDGSVTFRLIPQNGDGDSQCNLDGNSEFVTFNVVVANSSIATASQSTITFNGPTCNSTQTITIHPVAAGSTGITLTQGSTNSGVGTFNLAPAAFTVNVSAPADSTPPVITPHISPLPNGAGWNNANTTVSWTVTDPDSSISSTTGCGTTNLTTETSGTTLTCSATSGGGTSSQSVTVKIDKTNPDISGTATPAANGNGWNNTDVAVNFTCAETGAVQSGIATDTVAGGTLTTEGVGQSITSTGDCIDNADNAATATTVSGINIDKTGPIVTITTPVDGAAYIMGQTVNANWSATDALSGIDTVSGTVPSGSAIDTATVGIKTFTVTATDNAGNTTTKTVTYHVVKFDGLLAPISLSQKDFKSNSTIPVKFQISDGQGNGFNVGPATLFVDGNLAVSSGGSNIGNNFRYDTTAQQYIFNLSTKQISPLGHHTLTVKLNGTLVNTTVITIR